MCLSPKQRSALVVGIGLDPQKLKMSAPKTVLITGANSGIGLSCTKILAQKGWNVLLLCRKQAAGDAIVAELKQAYPTGIFKCYVADLADFVAVKKAASQVLADNPTLDVLLNNAGYYPDKIEYVDGIEKAFYASHLGHMLLTHLLMPALERAPEARIINVSSLIHNNGLVARFFTQPEGHSSMKAYADAKLANILFTMGLTKRLPAHITSYALHPGVVSTGFASDGTGFMGFMVRLFGGLLMSPDKGAATSIYLVTEDISVLKPLAGKYFDKKKAVATRNKDLTGANADLLWAKSEEILKRYW
jgi:retinol dehydrogenase 12